MKPSKINKILEQKFKLLLYGTSNTKFQNVFGRLCNICGLNKQEKNGVEVSEKKLSYGNLVPENI